MDELVARGVARPDLTDARFPRGARLLGLGAVVLVGIAAVSYTGWLLSGYTSDFWFQPAFVFDVGREHNIPTWYASILWVILGALGVLGAVLTERRVGWSVFAAVGFAAALDEYTQLHERLDQLGRPLADLLGLDLWFTWVLPAIPLMLLSAAVCLPLLWALPATQRWLLVIAGAVFFAGAVVTETISGQVLAVFGGEVTPHYMYVTMLEELLELLGVVVAIGAVAGLYSWRVVDGSLRVAFLGWGRRPQERRLPFGWGRSSAGGPPPGVP